MKVTRHRPSAFALVTTIAVACAVPATAQASAVVDMGAQQWSGAAANGFATQAPDVVSAAAGTYAAGSGAAFSWCDPYANSSIQSAVVNAVRSQAASPVVVTTGPSANGGGGLAKADSLISTSALGTNLVLGNISTNCIGAAVTQNQAGTSPSRRWTVALGDVALLDAQGPSVSGEVIRGTETNGWFTGPITVFWEGSDNQLLRGSTGVQISDGPTQVLGDAPDAVELSATLDPGADGTHTVTVYRTGGGGWPTAEAAASVKVDRTPPSVPQMIAPDAGAYPARLTTTPPTDGISGSGVARVEFSADGGRTILGSGELTVPGTYSVEARAVDVAGNASAWSTAIAITVPATGGSGTGNGGAATLHLAWVTVDGRSPTVGGFAALTRTWSRSFRISATVANGLGRVVRGARVIVSDPHGALVHGTTNGAGRIVLTVPVRRSGTIALTANGGGPLIHIVLRMRPLIALSAHDRHAISGTPLRLGPRRVLSVSGTAAPGRIVAGQPVELEYQVGRIWLPLGLPVPVARNGHWRLTYAVARPGSAVVRMRVMMPSQPGLPFAAGTSAAFRVAIR